MKLLAPKEVILMRLRIDRLNYLKYSQGLTPDEEDEMQDLILRLLENKRLKSDIELGSILLAGCKPGETNTGTKPSKLH